MLGGVGGGFGVGRGEDGYAPPSGGTHTMAILPHKIANCLRVIRRFFDHRSVPGHRQFNIGGT